MESREALDIELSPEHQKLNRMLREAVLFAEKHSMTCLCASAQWSEPGSIETNTSRMFRGDTSLLYSLLQMLYDGVDHAKKEPK